MQEALIDLITTDPAITALVGQAVTWNEIPQGSPSTGIVLWLISSVPGYVMDGEDGLTQSRVQVDCRALSYLAAVSLARAVKARLSGYRGVHAGTRFLGIFVAAERHSSDKLNANELFHRVSIDFTVWSAPAA